MVYAEKAGDGLYRSRAQLCRALGLASDDAPPGEGSHVDVWWDGGVGGWYAALARRPREFLERRGRGDDAAVAIRRRTPRL